MGLAMPERGPKGRRTRLAEADSLRRPVDREHLADDVRPRDGAPVAAVARLPAVVAHHEVVVVRDLLLGEVAPVAHAVQVRLVELLAVDVDEAVLAPDLLAG